VDREPHALRLVDNAVSLDAFEPQYEAVSSTKPATETL
jgi:hypothetical protein